MFIALAGEKLLTSALLRICVIRHTPSALIWYYRYTRISIKNSEIKNRGVSEKKLVDKRSARSIAVLRVVNRK